MLPAKPKSPIYRATWILSASCTSLRDEFNNTAIWADRCGLELLDIPQWESDGPYVAIMGGDLHAIFNFTATVGYPATRMVTTND
jgi:hypothetical protein